MKYIKLFEEFLNESADFKIQHLGSSGNKHILQIKNNGEIGSSFNQHGISMSLSNIAFNITPRDFEKEGYENSGTRDQISWVKDKAWESWNTSKGNPDKFVKAFSRWMKIPFTVVNTPKNESFINENRKDILNEADLTNFYDGFIMWNVETDHRYKFRYIKGRNNNVVESEAMELLQKKTGKEFRYFGVIKKGGWDKSKITSFVNESVDEDTLNESWDTERLLHKLHFTETEKDYEIAKNALKKATGWDDDDVDYSFKKFRKEIGFPDKYIDDLYDLNSVGLYVWANNKYFNWLEKYYPKPVEKAKSLWDKRKYEKWLKSQNTSGETDIEDSADFAYNAKFVPGLIDYVKNVIKRNGGDETPLQRIQWDIESYW